MAINYGTTPLPANGQTRSAAALAAIFNNIASEVNAYESSINASVSSFNVILGGRSSSGTAAGSIAMRDGNADLYSHSFVAGTGGALYGAGTRQITDASTGYILSAALPLAIPSYLIDGIQPGVTSSALTITWGSGFVTDGSGNAHQVSAGTRLCNDMPNPTTQANWGLLYVDKTTGVPNFIWTIATNAITPSTVLPTNGWAVMDIYAPPNAVGAIVSRAGWSSGTQAFFFDARYRNSGPPATGGGGGGGAAVLFASVVAPLSTTESGMLAQTGVTTPFNFYEWANGTQPALTRNGVALANIRLRETMIGDSTASSLEDANYVSVTGNIDQAIKFFTNFIRIDVDAGSPPITFKNGGKRFTVRDTDGNLDTPVISVADLSYTLYANVATGTFTLASSPPTGNYIPLKEYFWDGSTFYLEKDRIKPVINSQNLIKNIKRLIYTSPINAIVATGGAVNDLVAGTPGMVTFLLPAGNWRAQCRGSAVLQTVGAVGTTPDFRFYSKQSIGKSVPLSNSDGVEYSQLAPPAATAVQSMKWGGLFENLSGGYQNFGIGYYYVVGGSPGAYNIFSAVLEVEISRM